MTRTDVMASSRPHTAGAAPMRSGSSGVWRGLSILPLVLLALALVPAAALAEEPTSGYGTTPTTPTTSTKTNTTPSKAVEPSKEAEKPTTATTSEPTPTTSTAPSTEKAGTLPFTGFDLRWDIGFGLLLMIAGCSIVLLQRRHRRERGR
jgi:hypothetical protein